MATDMPPIPSLRTASSSPELEEVGVDVRDGRSRRSTTFAADGRSRRSTTVAADGRSRRSTLAADGRSRRSTTLAADGRSRRSTMEVPRQHFAGIDALRAFAAVAVVLLHACVPYASPSMSGLSWSVRDTASGPITVLFWSIELVIMPIFLVIAGFFASRSVSSRGGFSVTITRLRRLGWPLGLAILFLLPVEFYVWMLGWLADGVVTVREVQRIKFSGGVDRNLWGLSHLWFLQYLMTYTVILAVTSPWLNRCSNRAIMRCGLTGAFLTAVVALAMRPEVVWGFQHSFLPVLSKWVYSGAFFAAGVIWFQLDPQLVKIASSGKRLLGPGILLSMAAVTLGIWWLNMAGEPTAWLRGNWARAPTPNGSLSPAGGFSVGGVWIRSALAMLTVAAAAITTFALIGIASSRVRPLGSVLSTLAGGSFLIYLLHHPVVGLAHIVAKFALPSVSPWAKVAMITTLGVAAGWSVSWLVSRHRERILVREKMIRTLKFPPNSEAGDPTIKAA